MRSPNDRSDNGFTLIELLVTLSVAGILAGLAGTSLTSWAASNAHKGSRDEVTSALRNTAQRALSEGVTYCLAFASDGTWRTYKKECSPTGTLVSGIQSANTAGSAVAPTFSYLSGTIGTCTTAASSSSCAYFYPRGTAAAGTVVLSRSGKPTYTVNVEQLTSRVYTS